MAAIDRVTTAIAKKAPAADTPALVASAQKELARLGCYSGDDDGKLDAETKVAIKKYRVKKGEAADDVAVTEDFVSELGKQKLRVCSAAIVEKPEPTQHHEAKKETKPQQHKQASKSREREKPRARQQASSGGGGHPAMIGIGF
jgi:peptidoglycan hydrolase-like protein with peptidoglycan-binding domain